MKKKEVACAKYKDAVQLEFQLQFIYVGLLVRISMY